MKVVKLNIEKRTEKASGYANVKIEWEGNDISPKELDIFVSDSANEIIKLCEEYLCELLEQ